MQCDCVVPILVLPSLRPSAGFLRVRLTVTGTVMTAGMWLLVGAGICLWNPKVVSLCCALFGVVRLVVCGGGKGCVCRKCMVLWLASVAVLNQQFIVLVVRLPLDCRKPWSLQWLKPDQSDDC